MPESYKWPIAIRTDASIQIGTGHVMRCLALAQELRNNGARVVFVCREHLGNMFGLIESKGFELVRLGPVPDDDLKNGEKIHPEKNLSQLAHSEWLRADQDTDARQTINALQKDAPWDWLIVDHYALDHRWESSMRQMAEKIMVIDDLADRSHDCDLLLDQNYFQQPGKRYKGLLPEQSQALLGPKYALLRPEFKQARQFSRMRGNGIGRILVYFGGNDPANLTGMALEALGCPELSHLLVELVAGPNNQYLDLLKKQAQNRPGTRLHIQPKSFTELMLRSDLCIGAGGTTTWERLCLGLPGIVITVAENQEAFTAELNKAGYLTWLGRKEDVTVSAIREALLKKVLAYIEEKTATDMPRLVDGFGALRIAERLMPSPEGALSLRKAEMDDLDLFFFWANDPETRKNAFHQEPIIWDNHQNWFTAKLKSADTFIWVMQTAHGLPVGQIRFDIQNDTADIDYSLDPIVRGRGWAKKLLTLGLSKFKDENGNINPTARVKAENISSKRIFQRLPWLYGENGTGDKCFLLAVISDSDSWLNRYIPELLVDWLNKGHAVLWAHHPFELAAGDFCFLLGCGQLVPSATRALFKHNLVVHESDLPKGKGWSPLTWQILEGKNRIPITLIEADEKVDSGIIYAQSQIEFSGHDLVDELRSAQAESTLNLCKHFIKSYPEIIFQAREQKGKESFYPRRRPEDSRLDPDKTIRDQFNLLRVVDNETYPGWFDMHGQIYYLKIEKKQTQFRR